MFESAPERDPGESSLGVRDELDVIEHRQVQADDHRPHHAPHHDGQERLKQCRKIIHGDLDLLVVELANLLEHFVECTGLFSDLDHLHDQGGDHIFVLAKGIGQRSTLADSVLCLDENIANGAVARRVRANVERFENRDARANQ